MNYLRTKSTCTTGAPVCFSADRISLLSPERVVGQRLVVVESCCVARCPNTPEHSPSGTTTDLFSKTLRNCRKFIQRPINPPAEAHCSRTIGIPKQTQNKLTDLAVPNNTKRRTKPTPAFTVEKNTTITHPQGNYPSKRRRAENFAGKFH